MPLHKFQLFWPHGFWEEIFSLFTLMWKLTPPPPALWWPNHTSWDNNSNKLGSTLHVDASTQISALLVRWFSRERLLKSAKKFSIISNIPRKAWPCMLIYMSSSPKDALSSVWLKLAQWLRRRSRKCKNVYRRTDKKVVRKAYLSWF